MFRVALNRLFGLVVVAAAVQCGCGDGPKFGYVDGTVTQNGRPLEQATVEFQPDGEGSPSYGVTDENGYYVLQYTPEQQGAPVGRHTVRISTFRIFANEDGSKTTIAESVPVRYNDQSELTREVKGGWQTMDFAIEGEREEPGAD